MEVEVVPHREVCLRCRRPKRVCWCDAVTQVPSKTHVVFIQHPREAKVPISTCRMAHLSLPNSELHIGTSAVGNPALEAACRKADIAVLFPSESATDVDDLEHAPGTLVVVDGTWSNAKKVVEKCPILSKLPRLKFFPDRPGNYRIRKEPEEHCLATIEATAFVLEKLEHAPDRFTPILSAFDAMVDRQLTFINSTESTSRHKFRRRRNTVRVDPLDPLRDRELVVVFGEANAWPLCDPLRPLPDDPELVELAAERVSTGERFRKLLRPVRALGHACLRTSTRRPRRSSLLNREKKCSRSSRRFFDRVISRSVGVRSAPICSREKVTRLQSSSTCEASSRSCVAVELAASNRSPNRWVQNSATGMVEPCVASSHSHWSREKPSKVTSRHGEGDND